MNKKNMGLILSGNLIALVAVLAVGCKPVDQEAGGNTSQGAELTVQAASPSPSLLLPMKTPQEMESLEISAANGDAQAQFELGQRYFRGESVTQDYELAHQWCLKAASQGLAPAQIYVGVMNVEGMGVERNYSEALRWYGEAAAQNNPKAQFNLGIMHDNGQGVPRDSKTAFQWFEKAAKQDFAMAQFNLGTMYDLGQGVTQNLVASYYWFDRAYENGYAEALEARQSVTQRMAPKELAMIESGKFSPESALVTVGDEPEGK